MLAISIGALVVLILVLMQQGLHQIEEGNVGVYFNGGAITSRISEPGWHTKLPLVTSYQMVQTTVQTDRVEDVPCGTKGGVMIKFD
jgi:regulator of protease activity HflC (stomatin/prohibitin superfamily)